MVYFGGGQKVYVEQFYVMFLSLSISLCVSGEECQKRQLRFCRQILSPHFKLE